MPVSTVSSKGQVVIPAELRKHLGIGPGTQVEFVEDGGGLRLTIVRAVRASSLDDGFGMLVYDGPPRRLMDFDVAQAMRGRKP